MKKILLASTALVVGAAAQASASEPLTASVNGYMNAGVSFRDEGSTWNDVIPYQDGVGIMRDGEIHFNIKGTSDNGLTFDARVELEAWSSQFTEIVYSPGEGINSSLKGDIIDENWVRVSGSWGSIKLGSDDSASNRYQNGTLYAPSALIGYFDGFGYLGGVQAGAIGAGDYPGIHYDSPDFNGFRFGASYLPNRLNDGYLDSNSPVYPIDSALCDEVRCGNNYWSVGAVYEGEFDGFGFGIGGGYNTSDDNGSDQWQVGGNISASGFTLALHYQDQGSAADRTDMSIGLQYATGPWTMAGGYTQSDKGGSDPSVIAGWVTYAIAPGVSGTVGLEYGDPDTVDGQETLGGMAYLHLGF
jgi:hypothetical protein